MLKAKFIKEVHYPQCLSNVALVKNANGKRKMCINFNGLNKAWLKDKFPLSMIDRLVDAIAGHEMLSFMDAYLGCNHIKMHEFNQEKTSFIITIYIVI